MKPIEQHPFEPFLPNSARFLFLGTFPPRPEKWSMEFFYPNKINDMWRIMGLIFFGDRNHFWNEAVYQNWNHKPTFNELSTKPSIELLHT